MQDGNNNEPGWVFKPGDTPVQTSNEPTTSSLQPSESPVLPSVAPSIASIEATSPQPQPQNQPFETPVAPPAPLSFAQAQSVEPLSQQPQQENVAEAFENRDYPHVEWTASEYIAHQKSGGWYAILAVASLVIAAIVYFVTIGDIISTVVVLIIGLLLGVFAARQPNELSYAIDNTGIHVGQKFYPYESFKTFSVVRDHGLGYVSLEPLRRFMPPLTIHYDPSDEENIANTLAEYLPYEEHKPDIVDDLTRRFRF